MSTPESIEAVARRLIETSRYMTLATADASGRPWAAPVFYGADGATDFYWVSYPDHRHSRNVAERPEVAIVLFDSTVAVGEAQAVYISARAGEVTERADLETGIQVYARDCDRKGAPAWGLEKVLPPAPHRLYRATALEHSVLDTVGHPQPGDRRTRVEL